VVAKVAIDENMAIELAGGTKVMRHVKSQRKKVA
jgi:hypothetical protein